ncbi:lachesin-like [Panulirus ornatus]|uniref:lachesin-like n=1 Tax=Panulirus ornatus TaxID=150431 RepID=UPI003A899BF3
MRGLGGGDGSFGPLLTHCRIANLKDQSVSWYRRQGDEIHLITFGFQTYHNDDRFALTYVQPHDWRLRIRYVQRRDEGTYQCQVSTHPPLTLTLHLQVVEAAIQILDERGVVVKEKFYRAGSTIELQCLIADVPTATSLHLAWYRDTDRLNYDATRGGVSVKTELRGTVARSWLRVGNAVGEDSGTYYCNVTSLAATSVNIHVVPDEYPAAIQRAATTLSWVGLTLLACLASTLAHTLNSCTTCCCFSCLSSSSSSHR